MENRIDEVKESSATVTENGTISESKKIKQMSFKVAVFIATSLDGYIARKDGNIDWLMESDKRVPEGEDMGYNAFIKSVDTVIMGRCSYEKVLTLSAWGYERKNVIVLSSKEYEISSDMKKKQVSSTTESPIQLIQRLEKEGSKGVYVDGGKTIQSFLNEKLINEITITTIPVILGSGIPLFGPTKTGDIKLDLVESKAFKFGYVQSKYNIINQ